MGTESKFLGIGVKITGMVITMVIACSVSVGVFVYKSVEKDLYRLKGLAAQTAADTLAAILDPKAVLKLDQREVEDEYFYYLKNILEAVGTRTEFEFLYILTLSEDHMAFKVIYGQNSEGTFSLPLGYKKPVEEWNEASMRSYATYSHTYSQPYFAEEFGDVMISGYAPVFDDGGDVIAVVGLDIPLKDVITEITFLRNSIVIIVGAFVILFSIISIIYTRRRIGTPIMALSELSNHIVEGDLDFDTTVKSNDEIGVLAGDLFRVRAILNSLIKEIREMAEGQYNGALGTKIHAKKYSGAYKQVADGINDMTFSANSDMMEIMKTFTNFSKGNFALELRRFPGQKVIANESFDSFKAGLQAVYTEISTLIRDAADGRMQSRVSASKYEGDWRTLMEKLNHLLDTLNLPVNYARKIQKNLLPKGDVFQEAFSDYSIIWKPRDIVGGDIYWMKNFDEGSVLCVCDCTGHGTPGALLTMLVVSAFEATIDRQNYKDTAHILWNLEQRLVSVFRVADPEGNGKTSEVQDGCDLAVLYIAKDGSVTTSAGHTHVFVCDGKTVNRIKGQNLYIGEGKIKSKEDIKVVKIPANADNKFYIASDGLFDQIGGNPPRPFGYKRFMEIIHRLHNEKQSVISCEIWEAFENYRGEQPRRDDFELVTFKP